MNNNKVTLSGEVTKDAIYSHTVMGENFYMFEIRAERKSGISDFINVLISDRLTNIRDIYVGTTVIVEGQFRSHNQQIDEYKKKLLLYVFATEFGFVDSIYDENCIEMDGFLCKEPVYRVTPRGIEVTDLLIAVNRAYKNTDYIPCITWSRNAKFASNLSVGEAVRCKGRIQSRQYVKTLPDGSQEERVAYEVSISCIELLEEE